MPSVHDLWSRVPTGLLVLASLIAPPSLATPPAPGAETPGTPVLTLDEGGEEPRELLRYSPSVGAREPVLLVSELRTEHIVDGRSSVVRLPPTEFEGVLLVESSADGHIATRLTFNAVRIKPAPRLERGVIGSLRREWANLVGMSFASSVSPRGELASTNLVLPAEQPAPAPLREPIQALFDIVRNLQVPLPEEPIGVGALWTVTEKVTSDGVTYDRSTTYRVLRREAARWVIERVIVESAAPQPFDLGEMPASMTARITAIDGSARGTIVLDPTRLAPISVEQSKTLEMRVEGKAGIRTFTIVTRAHTTTRVTGAR